MRRIAIGAGLLALAAAAYFARPGPPAAPPPAPATPFLRTPTNPIRDLERSEAVAAEIGKAMKATLLAGLRGKDLAAVEAALSPDFEGQWPAPARGPWSDERGMSIAFDGAELPRLSRAAFLAAIEDTFTGAAAIERTAWHAMSNIVEAAAAGTRELVEQRVHFDLAGAAVDGSRFEWHATIVAELVRDGGAWKLRRFAFERGTRARSILPVFADLGPFVGFGFSPSATARADIQSAIDERRLFTVGGLNVIDFDRDGFWDILASYAGRETVLFRNDGRGGFVPQRLPLIDEPNVVSKAHLFLDLDDDGREELVGTNVEGYGAEHGELPLFTFDARGKMARRRGALRFQMPPWMRRVAFESVITCDVDKDQRLDLIVLGYSHLDSVEHESLVDAKDGVRNLLFMNRGGLVFSEESVARGLTDTRYSFVGECRDLDGDGDADLFVGNDYGPNNVYLNDGTGRFVHDDTHPLHLGGSFSMGISVADFDNTGRYAISVSNMYSHAGHRIIPLSAELSEEQRERLMLFVGGNSFFEQVDGRWLNRAEARGVDNAGWAWAGIFFDFDNDRDKDLYTVNGYTTHQDPAAPDF